jgi:hypothetical protein
MDDDVDSKVWRRQQRTRKVMVGAAMAAALAVVLGASFCSLYMERREPRRLSPATSSSGYPDPFLRMTRAGIDALDERGLCMALCRTHAECSAFQHPDWSRDSLDKMLTLCNVSCRINGVVGDPPDPTADRMARDCLKKLDCALFVECIFGDPLPRTTAAPSAPASAAPVPDKE